MLAAQMCLTTVDVRYDGLLRPGFGYIMARKVPGYWQLQKLLFSYSGRENFLLCTAAFTRIDPCASWPLLVLCLLFVPRIHFLNEDLIGSWWLSFLRMYLLTWAGSKIPVVITTHRSPCPQIFALHSTVLGKVSKVQCKLLGRVRFFVTPWTEFFRPAYWSR